MKTVFIGVLMLGLVGGAISIGVAMSRPRWTDVRCWDNGKLLYRGKAFYSDRLFGCSIETNTVEYRCTACYAVKSDN